MNATRYSILLGDEMDKIKTGMVEPGFDDFQKYREALQRYHAFKEARLMLKLPTIKEDEE